MPRRKRTNQSELQQVPIFEDQPREPELMVMCLGFRPSANTRPNVIRKTPHTAPNKVDHIADSPMGAHRND